MMHHIHLSDVPQSAVEALEKKRVTRVYKAGERLFAQDDMPDGMFCLQSGHVLLWHSDTFGYKTSFKMAGPGELVGYRSLLGDDNHSATAETLTACHACFFPKKELEQFIYNNPAVTRQFFRILARDRGPPDALLLRGQHLSIRIRLIYLLLIMKARHGQYEDDGALVYNLPLSRTNIASLIGSRPETVTRAIKELKRDGVVFFDNRRVVVPDPKKLFEEACIDTIPTGDS